MKSAFNIPWIKAHLEWGEIAKLAMESGISREYAYLVLNEKKEAFNLGFLMHCHAKAVERESILATVKEQSLKTVLQ